MVFSMAWERPRRAQSNSKWRCCEPWKPTRRSSSCTTNQSSRSVPAKWRRSSRSFGRFTPTRGMIFPDEFLPVDERTGLIVPIGNLVLREACRQVALWRRTIAHMDSIGVSVNLSTKQVESAGLLDDVRDSLASASTRHAEALTLELTEDLLVGDSTAVDDRLTALATLGVRLAIDDFGYWPHVLVVPQAVSRSRS